MNEDFYDDSQIGLEVDGERWAGRNYGFQSEESYNKLYVQGKLNPAQQAIERATSSIAGLPGIKQGLEFIGGATRFAYQQLPSPVQQAVEFGLAKNQEAAENIAAATGLPIALTDPTTIADVITGGATLAVKPGLKKAVRETVEGAANLGRNLPPPGATPQLAMAGATAGPTISVRNGSINLSPTVFEARTANRTMSQGEMLVDRTKQLQIKQNQIDTFKSRVEIIDELKGDQKNLLKAFEDDDLMQRYFKKYGTDAKALKKIRTKLGKEANDIEAEMSSISSQIEPFSAENRKFYKTTIGKTEKNRLAEKLNITPMQVHQHHLVSKGVTGAFYDTADVLVAQGKSKQNLLVRMMEEAKKRGLTTGDGELNILAFVDKSHSRFHTEMEMFNNIQESKKAWKKQLSKIKNEEEFMAEWIKWLEGDAKFTKESAETWQPMELVVSEVQNPTMTKKQLREELLKFKP